MRPKLSEQLKHCHCLLTVEEFKKVVEITFNELFPHWTDEQLFFQPQKAMKFDDEVRKRIRCYEMSDEVINRTLVNIRKSARSKHKRES